MTMNIEKKYNNQDLIMLIEGRVDTLTSEKLENEINKEINRVDSLTLDFKELEYISSAGLRVLIATNKELNKREVPLIITNVNETIKEIFRMSGFDKILKIE